MVHTHTSKHLFSLFLGLSHRHPSWTGPQLSSCIFSTTSYPASLGFSPQSGPSISVWPTPYSHASLFLCTLSPISNPSPLKDAQTLTILHSIAVVQATKISLTSTAMACQLVSLLCPVSYTPLSKQLHNNPGKTSQAMWLSCFKPASSAPSHSFTSLLCPMWSHMIWPPCPSNFTCYCTCCSFIHLQSHWPPGSWHTPNLGPLHVLTLVPGVIFPQLFIWLAYPLTSGLYPKVTSSEKPTQASLYKISVCPLSADCISPLPALFHFSLALILSAYIDYCHSSLLGYKLHSRNFGLSCSLMFLST